MGCRTELKTKNSKKKRISALESKLRAQENPHTPLSQQRFKGNSCANTNPPGKRGYPVDHHHAPLTLPEPEEIKYK
jgi:hypothetical protein